MARMTKIGLGLLVAVAGTSGATEKKNPAPAKEGAKEGVIDPKADEALHRMSDYLDGLKSFTVDVTTTDEKVSTEGQKIQEIKDSKVTLARPNQLRVDRVGPRGRATFRYDGKQVSLYNPDKNVYAVSPAPAELAAMIDDARDRLHVDAPGGDLLVPDTYHALLDGVTVGRYVGLEPIDGVQAHHLAMTKKGVDYQIWIKDGADPVPLRYVITSKDMDGQPQFSVDLRDWKPDAKVKADEFAFSPPQGAERINLEAKAKGREKNE